MLLVSAILGGAAPTKHMYEHAVDQAYRFLSYGDCNFIVKPR